MIQRHALPPKGQIAFSKREKNAILVKVRDSQEQRELHEETLKHAPAKRPVVENSAADIRKYILSNHASNFAYSTKEVKRYLKDVSDILGKNEK